MSARLWVLAPLVALLAACGQKEPPSPVVEAVERAGLASPGDRTPNEISAFLRANPALLASVKTQCQSLPKSDKTPTQSTICDVAGFIFIPGQGGPGFQGGSLDGAGR